MKLRQTKPLPNTCRGQLHLTSAGTPAPSGERHVDDKGGSGGEAGLSLSLCAEVSEIAPFPWNPLLRRPNSERPTGLERQHSPD
jgi:hypothetical protein